MNIHFHDTRNALVNIVYFVTLVYFCILTSIIGILEHAFRILHR